MHSLYTSNNEETRLEFEAKLKKKFNLTLMGQAKWYLEIGRASCRERVC